ncbi:uncharacterized protein ACA1_248350 [Acanthamoeba castellanii str. Neff]|uniref:NADH-ubiquinone oxidoreductase 21kDa subunit N-terminal domain-containing protein n=1 Tax=Acanthamoeba castellanii (strain ATCC 30010 / Neff) TaxID=1257118 RepID=L8H0C2_ACACF|nr:uncharacterized protein ACA1_248350 [Acanthamoeba castellanii str. Neff]ELR17831.1 hypothetical protein ACA1_248350 [Acanthamoeba castellanii str. Neff]
MVVFTEEPKNAVINPKPTYPSILWHMRLSDWGILVGLTGAGVAWGYMAGKGARKSVALCGGILGFLGGHSIAAQNSAQRLLGRKPNGRPISSEH